MVKGAVRHRKVLRNAIQGVTKPAIRRLARRGGVKRVSSLVYEDVRAELKQFLKRVLHKTILYTKHARRTTVTVQDVVYALKREGRVLYGFTDSSNAFAGKRKRRNGTMNVGSNRSGKNYAPVVYSAPSVPSVPSASSSSSASSASSASSSSSASNASSAPGSFENQISAALTESNNSNTDMVPMLEESGILNQ